jgi:hypothetical protein
MSEQNLTVQEKSLLALATPALPPDIQLMVDNAQRMAESLIIETQEDYDASMAMREAFKHNLSLIDGFLGHNIELLFGLHRSATAWRTRCRLNIEQADRLVGTKRLTWYNEQQRLARAKEQEDRERLRLEQETAAKQQAAELEKQGNPEAAAEVREQALTAPPPPVHVAPEVQKSKGAVIRKRYGFRIVNPRLVKPNFLKPDDQAIAAVVRASGEKAVDIVGGIEVYEEQSEHIRAPKR